MPDYVCQILLINNAHGVTDMTTEAPYTVAFLEEVQAFVERQGVAWGSDVRNLLHAEMSQALENETLRAWFAEASA